jgi:hypothetical protein
MAKRTSPTQRTLLAMRKKGFLSQVVERWLTIPNPKPGMPPGRRIDLFGFIDGISLTHDSIIGWQATSGSNLSSRITKIKYECREQAVEWLRAGGKIELWGWRKLSPLGTKVVRWKPIVRTVWLDQHDHLIDTPVDEEDRQDAVIARARLKEIDEVGC